MKIDETNKENFVAVCIALMKHHVLEQAPLPDPTVTISEDGKGFHVVMPVTICTEGECE